MEMNDSTKVPTGAKMTYTIIEPLGLLDGQNANKIRREVTDSITNGIKAIVVDFQGVTFINSSAIGALVATLKAVTAEGGEMFFCSLTPQVSMVFELTRMDSVFKICGDRSEALQKFANASSVPA
jgi:anti-sigma B factor antagonist